MITTFEVASIFKIKDEATAALRRMTEEVRVYSAEIKAAQENLSAMSRARLTGLTTRLKGLTDEAERVRTAFGTTFTAMDTQVAAATSDARLLAAEWRDVAAAVVASGRAMRGLNVASAAGAVNPRARVAGAHVSSFGIPLPGGHANIRGGSNAAMVGGGALAYGIYEESQFQDAAFRAMYTAGIPADKGERDRRMQELRDLIQKTSTQTGASISDIEEATLTGLRQFAGMPWDKRMQIMPQLLEGAAAEAVLKGHGTSVNEGMEVFTGLAHMTKEYSPEQIAALIPKFAYLSTVDPEKIKQMEKAASYAVPILQSGLDIDPTDTLLLTAALQRGGITNTKAGTWIREMALRAMPGTSLMSKVAFEKHEHALKEVGLVDDAGKPTWFTDGKPDLVKMLDIAGTHAKELPLTERAAVERQLFGAQGAGAFAVLSDPAVMAQIQTLKQEMPNFKTGASFFEDYQKNSPVQQWRDAWADLQKVLMDIGKTALPPVTGGLRVVDDILKEMAPYLPKQDTKRGAFAAAGTMLGGLAGTMFGMPVQGAAVGGAVGSELGNPRMSGGGFSAVPFDAVRLINYLWEKMSEGVAAKPIQVSTVINIDGRKVAEVVTKHQAQEGAGAAQGAPYHDSTYSTSPVDLSLVP
jgi:TP901 family phage tail tape measure protein